jgi:hypothetical protein
MRMLEPCGQLDLAEEALQALWPAQLRSHNLDRHRSLVAEVSSEIDGGHPAGADLSLEDVPLTQGSCEPLRDVAHG